MGLPAQDGFLSWEVAMGEGGCGHIEAIEAVKGPKRRECEDCVKTGGEWVHLRTCQECGGVRC